MLDLINDSSKHPFKDKNDNDKLKMAKSSDLEKAKQP